MLELVDGWDLGRVLHRAATAGVRLPRELALHVTAEVCRALAYAHRKTDGQTPLGIVHRDVSPHNILLSEQGEVKLTDFGIAKAMNKREHTGTGVVKGKVAFMSPEQAMGKPIDAALRSVFGGDDALSDGHALASVRGAERPRDAAAGAEGGLPAARGDRARSAARGRRDRRRARCARSPAERYQSADEMLGDVERVLRTVFRPVGQTELKRWLTELAARDGVPPISQSSATPARATATRTKTGTGELEEEDVVLLDTDEEDDRRRGGDLAGGGQGGRHLAARAPRGRARPSRTCRCPRTPNRCRTSRVASELALPIPEEEGGRPGRRRARRGSGFSILFIRRAAGGGCLVRRQVRPDVRPDLVRDRRDRRFG